MGKQRWEGSEKRREEERRGEKRREEKKREDQRRSEKIREDQRRERVRRKKMQVRENVGKSRNTVFSIFNDLWLRWSGRCGAIWPDERWKIARRCGPKHTWKSKCAKNTNIGALLQVEMSKKSARRCGKRNISKSRVLKLTVSDHFWKLRCWKSARRCGAKHISKSRCTKHTSFGAPDR